MGALTCFLLGVIHILLVFVLAEFVSQSQFEGPKSELMRENQIGATCVHLAITKHIIYFIRPYIGTSCFKK